MWNWGWRSPAAISARCEILDSRTHPVSGEHAPSRQGKILPAGGRLSPLRVWVDLPRNITLMFCTSVFWVWSQLSHKQVCSVGCGEEMGIENATFLSVPVALELFFRSRASVLLLVKWDCFQDWDRVTAAMGPLRGFTELAQARTLALDPCSPQTLLCEFLKLKMWSVRARAQLRF